MSFILDALRRADAERERGSVPGLNARPVPSASVEAGPLGRAGSVMWIGAAALAVALLVGWGAWTWRATPAPTVAVAAPVTPTPTAMPTPTPTPTPTPIATPRPTPTPAPAQSAVPAALPAPVRPPLPAVQPQAEGEPSAAPARVAVPRTPPRRSAEALTNPAVRPAASVPAATVSVQDRVPTQAELPEALRRELPALVFGGAMHSPNAASRMLIVNGQLFHEGEQLAPELWLEQIKLKDAVLRYKGQRYSVTF